MELIIGGVCLTLGIIIGLVFGRFLFANQLGNFKEERERLVEQTTMQFENLANKIFEQKSVKFNSESERNLHTILDPFKEKIVQLSSKVEETYGKESRERFALKGEIDQLVRYQQKVIDETQNFSRVLRGDIKAQGTWGEMVLEKILEASSLREGEEYISLAKGMGLTNDEGKKMRPDVVVNLPDHKHIIIDSKVSLVHYEKLVSSIDDGEKEKFLKSFISSINTHVDELSGKKYQLSQKLTTPEFVLMFIPNEGAFSLVIQNGEKFLSSTWEKQIVVVGPTTLLATLRTIASVWKQERQNKNALKIAREGGLLYDKFVAFVTDLQKIGHSISATENSYIEAMNKLKNGKGNLVAKVEKLKKLGAKASKKLPSELLDDDDDMEYSTLN